MKSEFLPSMAAPIQELGLCGLVVKTAGLQWFLLKWGGGDLWDLQVVFLGLLALGVCFAEHLASQPLAPLPKAKAAPQALKKTQPVAPPPAAPKAGVRSVVPKAKMVRPPRPPRLMKPPSGRKASDFSEHSTTAPSTPRSSGAVPVTILQPRPRRRAREDSSSSSELSSEWTTDSE
eukprot:CAMPEP_0114679712 /NCGR_PEP_ID=MMETSP0191-20121206/53228_1 /TAXON_ID=126664 /ORGANISM="Sorites sp." /LENGTH=175 /DNA_ID=CAMNT_0001955421 /DNA_START=19 /DNA_END=546 /DNA_ORIENTATION=+